jgi:MarR family transcriptional regulator, organic hydroperoxide resistance regulator
MNLPISMNDQIIDQATAEYIPGKLKRASTELPIERTREIWRMFLDPAFELLKSHFQSHYAERRLSSAQACMLQGLTEPMSQREAAQRLGYDPSNITALADALEAKGLVERRLDSSDRRVRRLARTPEGERLSRDLDQSLSDPPEALSRLSPHEQEDLLRLLSKVFGPSR